MVQQQPRCLLFATIVLAATAGAQTRPHIAEQIAKTYGLDSFGQIQAVRSVQRRVFGTGSFPFVVWEPKTDHVPYEGKDKDGNP
jgi:hypothetical protein